MELVAVDIGGTHARFAIATVDDTGTITLDEPITLHTDDHASFQTAWEDYKSRKGGSLPSDAALAIAGPITEDVIRFTNNPWTIRPALVNAKMGTQRNVIVNDFEAVAHAAAQLSDEHFIHLTGPDIPLAKTGTISVIGPGTGLGVAHFHRSADGSYQVNATEGGHIHFAPVDSIEDAILARLRKTHSRVSVERVVSGPGIVEIYQTLAAMEGRAVAEVDDITIWTKGTAGPENGGEDSLAAAAVDRFCLALGSVAGDLALAHGGFGGVVIAGGLGYRIRETLKTSGFAQRFTFKGRYQQLMASIPVKIVTHPQPGLLGAAAAFVKEYSSKES